MARSIRLVVVASLSVLSADDETKMNVEKHECYLLKVVSDAGSTPAASTISKLLIFQQLGNSDGKTQATLYSRAPEFAPIWRFEHNFAEVGVLMLSVYTRHHPDCKNAGDKTWRRCSCPKWIW